MDPAVDTLLGLRFAAQKCILGRVKNRIMLKGNATYSIRLASEVPQASPRLASSRIFLRVCEGQLPRQRRLEIRLQELHLPAAPLEEIALDLVRGAIVAGHDQSIGEQMAKISASWDACGRIGASRAP